MVEVNYRPFDLASEQQGRFSEKDWLVHSYEDPREGEALSTVFDEQVIALSLEIFGDVMGGND